MLSTLRALALLGAAAWPAIGAAQAPTLAPCPFKPAELQAALGVPFAEGKAEPALSASDLVRESCRYNAKNYTLMVSTTRYARGLSDPSLAFKGLGGKLVPIPNDPDNAVYQEGQGDNTSPAVHYFRKSVTVELRVLGIYYSSPSSREKDMQVLREKMAKLRRVP